MKDLVSKMGRNSSKIIYPSSDSMLNDSRKVLFNKDTHHNWQTRRCVYEFWNRKYNFDWDMAASKENTLNKNYVDEETDALSIEWPSNSNLWVNPPYDSRKLGLWFAKGAEAVQNGSQVVWLVHNRTDTIWYAEWAIRGKIINVTGRLHFLKGGVIKDPAPFPSVFIIFDKESFERYEKYGSEKLYVSIIHKNAFEFKRFPRPVIRYPR